MRKWTVVTVLSLLAVSCGGDDGSTSSQGDGGSSSNANEITVQVDGSPDDFEAFFLAYFPDSVTAHPGDAVTYKSFFTGEPHTITFGTLVEPAIEAFEKATPDELASDEPPPAFEPILPYVLLPDGPGDANQVSANPCFVTSGKLPEDTTKPCGTRTAAPFTGKEVFYNSGFLADGSTFTMQLAEDIEPGTYKGFCMLHLTAMTSAITVVPKSSPVPDAAEVKKHAGEQFNALVAKARTQLDLAKAAVTPNEVIAGDPPADEGQEDAPPAANTEFGLAEFTPHDVTVKSGEKLTWNLNGPHSITFNAPEDARVVLQTAGDGTSHVVEKATVPAQFAVPPPPEGPPTGPPPTVDLGSWDGAGFASTGLQFGGGFQLTFTKPGSYQYICVVHPDMEGKVNVTG